MKSLEAPRQAEMKDDLKAARHVFQDDLTDEDATCDEAASRASSNEDNDALTGTVIEKTEQFAKAMMSFESLCLEQHEAETP